VTDLDADVIAQWPQVASAERDGTRMHVSTSAAENVLRRMLDADTSLSELEVQRAGLADAFTELTREDNLIEQEAA
jgi:ABC-2 type transport system ATP-binding protein